MKKCILLFAFAIVFNSCGVFGSLNSNTSIKPNESFYLGNNKHGSFKVKLKNVSNHDIEIYFAPIDGGTHSRQVVVVNQEIILKAERNTAIVIENKNKDYASVNLKVTGDLNLGMTYNK